MKSGGLGWILRVAVLAAIILGALALSRDNPAQAVSFSPFLQVTVSDPSSGANGDIITNFFIAAPDSFPSTVVSFTPPAWGVASDSLVPTGAVIGTLASIPTVGILNGPCSTQLPAVFTLLDALADPLSPNTIGGSPSDPTWVGYQDTDLDGLPEAVDNWPTFLNPLLAQQGNAIPIARYYGQTTIAGTLVALNFLVFAPGALPGFAASLGYGSFTVLLDPFAPLAPSFTTDACSPLNVVATILGLSQDNGSTGANEGGFAVRTNPVEGAHAFTISAVSGRDSEPPCTKNVQVGFSCAGDGIENGLDTCALAVNVGDPRVFGSGDPDNDGLDSACDPNPGVSDGVDADGDGFLNRQDNCPLVANGGAAQVEIAELLNPDPPPPPASLTDGIGDQCDPHPDVPDGHFHVVEITDTVVIGPHDIELVRLRGGEHMAGGQTKTYVATVRNNALVTEQIQAAIGAFPIPGAGCGLPSIPGGVPVDTTGDSVPDGTVLFTSVTVSPGRTPGKVSADVTFPVCAPDIGSPEDYLIVADACHAGDPAPLGFIFSPTLPCSGTSDGVTDPNPANDAFVQKSVDDRNR